MDCVEVKSQGPFEEQLEPLLILEDGDEPEDFTNILSKEKLILRVKMADEDMEEDTTVCSKSEVEDEGKAMLLDIEMAEESKMMDQDDEECQRMDQEASEIPKEFEPKENQSDDGGQVMEEVVGAMAEKTASQEDPHVESPKSVKLRSKSLLLRPEDLHRKMHRLSSDSPDALYDLLCALQEGRRLNDQRCSFTLQPRRRCHSVPSASQNSHRVVFSSMTSLQKEEFFDLVATSQARRLDDQRAVFQIPSSSRPPPAEARRPSSAPASIPSTRPKSRRSSWKQVMDFGQSAPKPPPKEDLYNMIVTSQSQGRLEEQRSKAPGPMDDEDFFSLLLKVQGGRMDEQRTELPVSLRY